MRPILFCIGAVTCDVVTTYTIVGTLGGEELNPLVATMIGWGWFWFLIVKYGVGFLLPLWHGVLTSSRRMLWTIKDWRLSSSKRTKATCIKRERPCNLY